MNPQQMKEIKDFMGEKVSNLEKLINEKFKNFENQLSVANRSYDAVRSDVNTALTKATDNQFKLGENTKDISNNAKSIKEATDKLNIIWQERRIFFGIISFLGVGNILLLIAVVVSIAQASQ